MFDVSMLIGGQPARAGGGATFERRNPLDNAVATRAPAATAADAIAACEAAASAFKTWSQTGPNHRRTLLLKVADVLEAKTPQFVEGRQHVDASHGARSRDAGDADLP